MVNALSPEEEVALDRRLHEFLDSDLSDLSELPEFMFKIAEAAQNDSDFIRVGLLENLDKLFTRLVVSIASDNLSDEDLLEIHSSITSGVSLKYFPNSAVINSGFIDQWNGYLKIANALEKAKSINKLKRY